jgi:hypothetical protein
MNRSAVFISTPSYRMSSECADFQRLLLRFAELVQ